MSQVIFSDKPMGATKCSKKKGIVGFSLDNPFFTTGLVAVGTYFLAKKAKLL